MDSIFKKPRSFSTVISKNKPRIPQRVAAFINPAVWEETVGKQLASHCRPGRIKGSILYLIVPSSAWVSELEMLKDDILERIKKSIPRKKIKELRFVVGMLPEKKEVPSVTEKQEHRDLSSKEEYMIDMACRNIPDSDLRDAFEELLNNHYRKSPLQSND